MHYRYKLYWLGLKVNVNFFWYLIFFIYSDHGFGIVILRCIDFVDDANNVLDYVKATINFCQSLNLQQASEMGIRLVPSVVISHEATDLDIANCKCELFQLYLFATFLWTEGRKSTLHIRHGLLSYHLDT